FALISYESFVRAMRGEPAGRTTGFATECTTPSVPASLEEVEFPNSSTREYDGEDINVGDERAVLMPVLEFDFGNYTDLTTCTTSGAFFSEDVRERSNPSRTWSFWFFDEE